VILIDANILMYAAGAPHAHKAASADLVEDVAKGLVDACVDAEVLHEILHRYRALNRWDEGRLAFDLARQACPVVVPVTGDTVDHARRLMDDHPRLSARDALHSAVVVTFGLRAICSFDTDFDVVKGVRRLEPERVPRRRAKRR
jgi:uncharacterized protein